MPDLLTQLSEYSRQLDDETPALEALMNRVVNPSPRPVTARPWVVLVGTAIAVLLLLGLPTLLRGVWGDAPPADQPPPTTVAPSTTTTSAPEAIDPTTVGVPSMAVEGGTDVLATTIAKPNPPVATCPAGSRPDEPGPASQERPLDASVATVFDRQSGKVVVPMEGPTWIFDVCSNTWTRMRDSGFSDSDAVVYDADSDLLVDIDYGRATYVYDVDTDTWRDILTRPRPAGVGSWFDAFYDPVTGLIVTRNVETSTMWAYDVDTDTWAQVDQGSITPPPRGGAMLRQTMVYDPDADRIVFHTADNHIGGSLWESSGIHRTWTFDPRAAVWTVEPTLTPDLGWGWGAVYDESAHLSVFFGDEVIAAYDSVTHEWRVLWHVGADGGEGGPYTALPRGGGAPCWLTYDPINERILAHEGDTKGIWAFDSKTATWIELLAPEEPGE